MDEYSTNEESIIYNDAPYIPAVNTYVNPDTPGYTPPFDHLSRLADKLFGAVTLNIDNATAQARIQQARNNAMAQQASGQVALLPQPIGAWLQRNSGQIFTMVILAGIFFLGSLALKR